MKPESHANPPTLSAPSANMACPCSEGKQAVRYALCCGPAHAGTPPTTAAALMRSRYSAYVLGNADYLLQTWASTTRPASLDLTTAPQPRWLGLRILRHQETGDKAEVEFVARFRMNGRAQVLHEISRFVRENGRWFYVDGIFP